MFKNNEPVVLKRKSPATSFQRNLVDFQWTAVIIRRFGIAENTIVIFRASQFNIRLFIALMKWADVTQQENINVHFYNHSPNMGLNFEQLQNTIIYFSSFEW